MTSRYARDMPGTVIGQPRPRRRDTLAFTVVVSVLVVLGGAGMLLVLALSGAPRTMVIATVLATVPVVPLVACYLWLDRYEPEPRRLLAAGLLWGGFVATAVAIVLQGIGGLFVGLSDETSLAVVAPVTEEATKGSFLLLLLWWRRAELDGVLDGLVYAGMVGIGFAFVENILYLAAAYNGTDGNGPGGTSALTTTFVVRCLFSPFAHPFFTSFIGIGVGIAVASRTRPLRFLAPLLGYLLAVTAHGIWNGSTLLRGQLHPRLRRAMAPAFLGAGRLRGLGAALGAADARRRARRRGSPGPLPGTDIGWLVDLAPAAGAGPRQPVGGDRAARDAGVPAGGGRARLPAPPLPSRYAAAGLRGPRPSTSRGSRAVRPHVTFPGQVVPAR